MGDIRSLRECARPGRLSHGLECGAPGWNRARARIPDAHPDETVWQARRIDGRRDFPRLRRCELRHRPLVGSGWRLSGEWGQSIEQHRSARVAIDANTWPQCRMHYTLACMRPVRVAESPAGPRMFAQGVNRSTQMDVHQLELFLAVMNSPSMTRAAEKIHLSPGAVSLQLHNLADELHTELFVRRGKKLVPTPAALRLAEHAKEVVRMMGHIQQLFENDLAKDVRPFHFATGVTTLIYQLGAPLRQLRKRYPNAEIRVTVGVTE